MSRFSHIAAASALLFTAGACTNIFGNDAPPDATGAVTAAFSTVPLGFSDISSSYGGDAGGVRSMWLPGSRARGFAHGEMMGGGLGEAFAGGIGPGRGRGHEGPFGGRFVGGFSCTGSYDAPSARYVCDPVTRNGLTTTQSAAYKSAAGTAQQAFDTLTTNEVNVQTQVTGTVSFSRDSAGGHRGPGGPGGHGGPRHTGGIAGDTTTILTATTTVSHASDRTVSGLASGSTQRTVNGTSSGQESSTGTSSRGAFTASRTAADTTKGLVVPIADGRPSYPTAGTVIRVMTASVSYAGQGATTATRREVITYDGSATAKVTITTNGSTQSCTRPLPRGRLSCA